MYTFTMVGCTLFKFCHFKCAKVYLLEILGMSGLWHDLMAHGPIHVIEIKFTQENHTQSLSSIVMCLHYVWFLKTKYKWIQKLINFPIFGHLFILPFCAWEKDY